MSRIEKILVVDDERLLADFLQEALTRLGYEVEVAFKGEEALKIMDQKEFDLVITDMKMGKISGMDLIKTAKERFPRTLFIVMTAYGSIENAVLAMHAGAFDYLLKPFSLDAIEALLKKAKEHQALIQENVHLKATQAEETPIPQFSSPKMQTLSEALIRAAATQASIFLTGESGVGKEVLANLIHTSSPRKDKPFIKINCAALPETLLESELFGYEKGAFTGANSKKLGRFELAQGGTLLLDEITEMPLGLQAKLLRAIQEKEIERLGGSKPIPIDVRLISTSNRNLKEAISQGMMREDLYFRLNVVPIEIPPLRERKEEIIPLAESFLKNSTKTNHLVSKTLSPAAKEALLSYSWPGNIRELSNVMERASILAAGSLIEPADLRLETLVA